MSKILIINGDDMRHFSIITVTLVFFLCSCGLFTEDDKGDEEESYPSFELTEQPHFASRPITDLYIDSSGINYIGTFEGIAIEHIQGDFAYLDAEVTSKSARIKEMYGVYYARSGDKSLISSTDGKSWAEVMKFEESIYDYVVLKSGRIVIGIFEGVYYKDPEEIEWTRKRFFFAGNNISNINRISHLVETEAGDLIAGTHNGIYRSLDEGENWERVSGKISKEEDDISQLLVKENGDILAYATRYAYVSEDNGDSWFTSTLPSRGVFKAIEDNGIEYILIGGNIWARKTSRDVYVNLEIVDELKEKFGVTASGIDIFYLRGEKLLIYYNSVYPTSVYSGIRVDESDIWDKLK
tara:strand:+ start:1772 stop:2830 length:1059 start_codon:yes stop_codon:yes gene_type:complete